MAGPTSNLPTISSAERAVTVLIVSHHEEDHDCLAGIFRKTNWKLYSARNCTEASGILRTTPIAVVLSDCELPDGDWKVMLQVAGAVPTEPLVVVASSKVDSRLCAEALNLGAYDVLAKPFDQAEVTRILSLAWLHWRDLQVRARRQSTRERQSDYPRRFSATA